MRTSRFVCATCAASIILSGSVTPASAQRIGNRPSAVIWHDRGDAAVLDLTTGPGSKDGEPGTDFTFIKESTSGTSPKFDVVDERGVRWKVKMGEEARTESAASRLLWAAGYTVDEDYYRPQIHVRGLAPLARGGEFVTHGDTVTAVRLERDVPAGDSVTWDWYDNPLVGTRDFNGLRVMMALVNNWDLKAINNNASGTSTGGGQYSVSDLGATFGRTGNSLKRSKGIVKDYADSAFIEKVTPDYVDFRVNSRPFFLSIVNFRNYRFRTRMQGVVKHVPIADARWIGDRLAALSPAQIGDSFRAAGFPAGDVDAYTRVVVQRIAALEMLGDGVAASPPSVPAADPTGCLASTCRQVPLRETLTAINVGTPYAHAIFGGFEQGSGIGGGVQLTTARAIPAVELRATALRSTRKDRRLDLEALLPNIGGTRNHADVWFTDLHRRTDFYGIGPATSQDLETEFTVDRRSYQASIYRDLAAHLQGGVFAQVMDTHGVLAADPTDSQIFSYGAFLSYDTRDNSIGLTRGLNLFGRMASAAGVGRRNDANYGWTETEVDARAYAPLGSSRTSLLLRTRAQFKEPSAGGHAIPYYDLSWLGGRQYLRGYHSYRFRDDNVLLISSELQQTIVPFNHTRGIDVFASADTGQVWGPERFDAHHWQSGFGGGLQYRHSRSVAARIEAGRSRERIALYASVSRGF